jgi:hypothetical protein
MAFAEFPVQSLMYITNRPELVFTEGKGSWLTDHNGKRYLDFVQGWAVNCLGHANQGMIDALVEQSKKIINPSPAFYNEPMLRLAKQLTDHSCFDKVFFANSGAEANEGAIKLARKWGRKHKNGAYEIITMDRAAGAGLPQGRAERPGLGREADHRQDRRHHAGAGAGRRRRDPRHARVHAGPARAGRQAQAAVHRR